MNNIVDNFAQILDFAKNYGLPTIKKRAILREYLQSKIIDGLYHEKKSTQLYFIGGTSLRLLRNLDRFSEDLDFDVNNITGPEIQKIMEGQFKKLRRENIELSLYKNVKPNKTYFEFRFEKLLHELNISNNKDEKLCIKFDFESHWKHQTHDLVLLNKYGFLVNVLTISKDQILVQKLFAYINRKETVPRDIYDIVWLVTMGAKIDRQYIKDNKLSKNLLTLVLNKYNLEKEKIWHYKEKLRPFLINEEYVSKLDLFETVKNLEYI